MRSSISSRDAPWRVQRTISSRKPAIERHLLGGNYIRAPVVPLPRAGLRRAPDVSAISSAGAGSASQRGDRPRLAIRRADTPSAQAAMGPSGSHGVDWLVAARWVFLASPPPFERLFPQRGSRKRVGHDRPQNSPARGNAG